MRTNRMKTRINKTKQNSRCWLCGDSDESINKKINECNILA